MIFARLTRKLLTFWCAIVLYFREFRQHKTLYLTFDDGPNITYTETVLDILAQHHIKATFFLIGKEVIENEPIVSKIIAAGHMIGFHSYSHRSFPLMSRAERRSEIQHCLQLIEEMRYSGTKMFRPPFGLLDFIDLLYLSRHGFKTILWTFDSRDYLHDMSIESRLLKLPGKHHVVLFHDDSQLTCDILHKVLPEWIRQGYKFGNF